MKQYLEAVLIIIVISSCGIEPTELTRLPEFHFQSTEWDSIPYRLSDYISDSIVSDKGQEYASWMYSRIGDQDGLLKVWDEGRHTPRQLDSTEISDFGQFKPVDAITYISSESQKHEVTIINEAHHMPQHRVFTTQLLQNLYNNGYRHLGLEAFVESDEGDSVLRQHNYVDLTMGFYVKEPTFGNLIRKAHELGYSIFGYEAERGFHGKDREEDQANKIVSYRRAHPEGKILIHCGFAHGAEGDYGGSWEKTMAGRLSEKLKTDPLTIEQTKYSEKSSKEYENPFYRLTDFDESSVLIHGDSIFGQKYRHESWYDIPVFHPRSGSGDRPKWLLYFSHLDLGHTFVIQTLFGCILGLAVT